MHLCINFTKNRYYRIRRDQMTQNEYEAIEILKTGEPLPVDIYISLNNSGIDPEFLINLFKKEEQLEPN